MKHLIYKLTRKSDGKEYIGITINYRLKNRLNQHKCHNRFKNDSFDYDILFENEDRKIVEDLEPEYIEKYKTHEEFGGLNKTRGGKGYNHNSPNFNTLGYKYSQQSRRKMSDSAKLRYEKEGFEKRSKRIKQSWINGGEELRKRQSNARKGRIISPKLTNNQIEEIRTKFANYTPSEKVGTKSRNGKIFRAENEFSNLVCSDYNVSNVTIRNVLDKKCIR